MARSRCWRSALVAALGLCAARTAAAAYSESIVGASLIGSHFGVPGFNASFEYVVVGGGTAGLTVATRLAQAGKSVAVVEAGSFYEMDNGNLSSIPGDSAYFVGANPLLRNPLVDWGIETTSQPGLGGRSLLYVTGKCLGGSSARNYLLYQRGTIGAYQKWADDIGDQSYTFSKLLPYFKKSVKFEPPNNGNRIKNASVPYQLSAYDAAGGPLKVSYSNWGNAFSSWLIRSLKDLGLNSVPDFVSGKLIGYQYVAATLDQQSQTRSSSETSFLRQALSSTDAVAYTNTLAKQIQFDASKKATSVVVSRSGLTWTLNATKEVIVASGAFRSPQLLMVSGVGPRDTLSKYKIPVVADRPGVGQNMWDHTLFGAAYPVGVYTHSRLSDPAFAVEQAKAYAINRTGILSSTGADILGWEKLPQKLASQLKPATKKALDAYPSDWPDVELLFLDGYSGNQYDFLTGGPTDGKQYASASAALVKPFGRGNVTISSKDTADNPVVDPNLLLDSRDQEVAIAAFKRVREIFATKAIQPVVTGPEKYPGANVTTDAQILDALKKQANVVYHAASTCAMGKSSDPMAVVDSQGKVIGVSNLRVIDASALPFLPPGHPQATIYALAEKLTQMILSSSY